MEAVVACSSSSEGETEVDNDSCHASLWQKSNYEIEQEQLLDAQKINVAVFYHQKRTLLTYWRVWSKVLRAAEKITDLTEQHGMYWNGKRFIKRWVEFIKLRKVLNKWQRIAEKAYELRRKKWGIQGWIRFRVHRQKLVQSVWQRDFVVKDRMVKRWKMLILIRHKKEYNSKLGTWHFVDRQVRCGIFRWHMYTKNKAESAQHIWMATQKYKQTMFRLFAYRIQLSSPRYMAYHKVKQLVTQNLQIRAFQCYVGRVHKIIDNRAKKDRLDYYYHSNSIIRGVRQWKKLTDTIYPQRAIVVKLRISLARQRVKKGIADWRKRTLWSKRKFELHKKAYDFRHMMLQSTMYYKWAEHTMYVAKLKVAAIHYAKKLCAKYWKRYGMYLHERQRKQLSIHIGAQFQQDKAKLLTIQQWLDFKNDRQRYDEKIKCSQRHYETIVRASCFQLWSNEYLQYCAKKRLLFTLLNQQRSFVMRNIFRAWQKIVIVHAKVKNAASFSVRLVMLTAISRWKRNNKVALEYRRICLVAKNHYSRKLFCYWKIYDARVRLKKLVLQRARRFYDKCLQRLAFRQIILFVKRQRQKAVKVSYAHTMYAMNIVNNYFNSWSIYAVISSENNIAKQVAREHYELYLENVIFLNWYKAIQNQKRIKLATMQVKMLNQITKLHHALQFWQEETSRATYLKAQKLRAVTVHRLNSTVTIFERWHSYSNREVILKLQAIVFQVRQIEMRKRSGIDAFIYNANSVSNAHRIGECLDTIYHQFCAHHALRRFSANVFRKYQTKHKKLLADALHRKQILKFFLSHWVVGCEIVYTKKVHMRRACQHAIVSQTKRSVRHWHGQIKELIHTKYARHNFCKLVFQRWKGKLAFYETRRRCLFNAHQYHDTRALKRAVYCLFRHQYCCKVIQSGLVALQSSRMHAAFQVLVRYKLVSIQKKNEKAKATRHFLTYSYYKFMHKWCHEVFHNCDVRKSIAEKAHSRYICTRIFVAWRNWYSRRKVARYRFGLSFEQWLHQTTHSIFEKFKIYMQHRHERKSYLANLEHEYYKRKATYFVQNRWYPYAKQLGKHHTQMTVSKRYCEKHSRVRVIRKWISLLVVARKRESIQDMAADHWRDRLLRQCYNKLHAYKIRKMRWKQSLSSTLAEFEDCQLQRSIRWWRYKVKELQFILRLTKRAIRHRWIRGTTRSVNVWHKYATENHQHRANIAVAKKLMNHRWNSFYFYSWSSFVKYKKLKCIALRQWNVAALRASFRSWIESSIFLRNKRIAMTMATEFSVQHSMYTFIARWKRRRANNAAWELRIKESTRYDRLRTLHEYFKKLIWFAQNCKRHEKLLNAAANHHAMMSMVHGIRHWNRNTRQLRRHKKFVKSITQRHNTNLKQAIMILWSNTIAVLRDTEQKVFMASNCCLQLQIRRYFKGWVKYHIHQQNTKTIYEVSESLHERQLLRRGVRGFHLASQARFLTRYRKVQAKKQLRRHLLLAAFASLRRAWCIRRVRIAKLGQCVSRYDQHLLRLVVQTWCIEAYTIGVQIKLKKIMEYVCMKKRWLNWQAYHEKAKHKRKILSQALHYRSRTVWQRTFRHWEMITTTLWIHHQFHYLAILHYQQHLKRSLFTTWKIEHQRYSHRTKRRRYFRQHCRQLLSAIFSKWHKFTRANQRGLLLLKAKIVNAMETHFIKWLRAIFYRHQQVPKPWSPRKLSSIIAQPEPVPPIFTSHPEHFDL